MTNDPNQQAVGPVHVETMRGVVAEAVHGEMDRRAKKGFRGAIIVDIDGVVRLKAGYGWANRERQVPFTTVTIAQIGSLTKQFTAAAVVALSLQGRIALSGLLQDYLPGVPAHAAGLPDSCGDDFDRLARDELTIKRGVHHV